jgi:MFS family permease
MRAGIKPWQLVLFASLVMGGCILGMLSESLSDGLRYALCLVFSISGGVWPASAYVHAMTAIETPEQRGAMNGLLVNGSTMGSFFGPLALAAAVTAFGDWYVVAWGILGICLLAAIIAVAFRNAR